ncbi:hypothetical protein BRC67_05275 [Halobacteriales archaeon QH_3_68_24]|nr:MAG: hypothetical protein BRC67_05275 [Halobacteriales archaeon QH_3_68_24]
MRARARTHPRPRQGDRQRRAGGGESDGRQLPLATGGGPAAVSRRARYRALAAATEPREFILPAVSLSRISPPRGGEYLHEVTAGSITRRPLSSPSRWWASRSQSR